MLDKLLHRYLFIPYKLHIRTYRKLRGTKRTIVFLHGLGSSGVIWQPVIDRNLHANVIVIDLLGFGQSPAPAWAKYDANTQARAVAHTLRLLGIIQPVTIVGHSMGALVGIEIAKKYSKHVRNLILCSPPLYRHDNEYSLTLKPNKLLPKLYQAAQANPSQFARLAAYATKYKLVNEGFNVTSENIETYLAALEGMILNQTSYDDALQLKMPTYVIYGTLDPFIITNDIKTLAHNNQNISLKPVLAGHEVQGLLLKAVQTKLTELLAK